MQDMQDSKATNIPPEPRKKRKELSRKLAGIFPSPFSTTSPSPQDPAKKELHES